MTQRARKTPVDVAERTPPGAQPENTLTRISLALTQHFAIDDVNRGTDPYNTTGDTGRAGVWNKQRSRR